MNKFDTRKINEYEGPSHQILGSYLDQFVSLIRVARSFFPPENLLVSAWMKEEQKI